MTSTLASFWMTLRASALSFPPLQETRAFISARPKPKPLEARRWEALWIDFRAQDSHTEREYCSSETMIAQGKTFTRWCRDKRSWLVRSAEPDSASDERRRGEQFDNRHQCSTTEGRSRGGLSGLSGRLGSTALHCGGLSRSAGSRRLRGAFPRGAKGP